MPKLFIHAGTPKTASTLVQSQFSKGQILESVGIKYPEIGRSPNAIAHHDLFRAVRNKAAEPYLDQLADFMAWNTLVSSEGFALLSETRTSNLRTFLNDAANRGWQPHIIIFIREATSYIESWYLQRVKSGRFTGSFEDFMQIGDQFYAQLFAGLADMRDIGEQSVYPFLPERHQEDWRDALGAPVSLDLTLRRNTRLPIKAETFMFMLDEIASERGVQLDRRKAIVRFHKDSPFPDDTTDYTLWSPEDARKVHKRVLDIAQEHGYSAYVEAFAAQSPTSRQKVTISRDLLTDADKSAGVEFLTRAAG